MWYGVVESGVECDVVQGGLWYAKGTMPQRDPRLSGW